MAAYAGQLKVSRDFGRSREAAARLGFKEAVADPRAGSIY